MLPDSMLRIDGSAKSGSGTILRTAGVIAALLGEEAEIRNIRALRPRPGLRPQHVAVLEAVRDLTGIELEGADIDSSCVLIRPGRDTAKSNSHVWDIGTAGSSVMLAEALLPIALFADSPCKFTIRGGIFQDFAPTGYHAQHALLPLLKRMGAELDFTIVRPGYYPKGGGVLEVTTRPLVGALRSLDLNRQGSLRRLWGVALSSHLERQKVNERMAGGCTKVLTRRHLSADEYRLVCDHTAPQPGAAFAVFAEGENGWVLGSDMAGARGRRAEDIGQQVGENLWQDLQSGATVDRFLADQLLLPTALATGVSHFIIPRLTEHVETNLWLIEELLGARVKLEAQNVCIEGVGFRR